MRNWMSCLAIGLVFLLPWQLSATPKVQQVTVHDLTSILTKDLGYVPRSGCTMPFSRSAANSTLSVAALVFDSRCQKSGKTKGAKILVVDLPEDSGLPARTLKVIDVPKAQGITQLEFYDTSLLRVEVKLAENKYSYLFKSVEGNYEFNLLEDIDLPNISAIRHLGRDLYVVHHQSLDPNEFDVSQFSIVRHDPYLRETSIVNTLAQPELGWDMIRDEADIHERTIWRLGGRDIVFRFNHNTVSEGWQEWILSWKNAKFELTPSIELGLDFSDPVSRQASTLALSQRELKPIQGTDRYYQDDDPNYVFVFETDEQNGLLPIVSFQDVESEISLTFVSGPSRDIAFLGSDEIGNHYLFSNHQVTPLTSSESRLSLVSYQDGGFFGLRYSEGSIILRRHIYDREALSRVQIPPRVRRDCSSLVSST